MSNYSTEILPDRFVYHVTLQDLRSTILKEGIKAHSSQTINYHNAVFAHNSPIVTMQWYPFVLDHYDWRLIYDEEPFPVPNDTEILKEVIEQYYDIWAIDTQLLKRKWYIDGVGEKEFGCSLFKKEGLYIMSQGDIPSNAIFRCEPNFERKRIDLNSGWMEAQLIVLAKAA